MLHTHMLSHAHTYMLMYTNAAVLKLEKYHSIGIFYLPFIWQSYECPAQRNYFYTLQATICMEMRWKYPYLHIYWSQSSDVDEMISLRESGDQGFQGIQQL